MSPKTLRRRPRFAKKIRAFRSVDRGDELKPLWFASVPKGESTFEPCLVACGEACVLRNPFNDSRIFVTLHVNGRVRGAGWLAPNGALTITLQDEDKLAMVGATPR